MANNKYKCLIAEDDTSFRMMAGSCIGQYETIAFEKFQATDVETALTKFAKERPDLVFLDINMPDGSGIDALEKIMEIDPRTFVVMVTGSNALSDVLKAEELGAKGYILKPFSTKKIHEAINSFKSYRETKTDDETLATSTQEALSLVKDYLLEREEDIALSEWDLTLEAIKDWNILIIDQSQENLGFTKNYLKPLVKSVATVNHSAALPESLSDHTFSVVMFDLTMPNVQINSFIKDVFGFRKDPLKPTHILGLVDTKDDIDPGLVAKGFLTFMLRGFNEDRINKALIRCYQAELRNADELMVY